MQTFQIRFLSLSQAQSWFEYPFFLELITNLQFRHQARSNYYCFKLYQGKYRARFSDSAPQILPKGHRANQAHVCARPWVCGSCSHVGMRVREEDIFFSNFDKITSFFTYLYLGLLGRLFFWKSNRNCRWCWVFLSHTSAYPIVPYLESQKETFSFNCKLFFTV